MSISSTIGNAISSSVVAAKNAIMENPKKSFAVAATLIGTAGLAYYIHTNLDSIKDSAQTAYDTAADFIANLAGNKETPAKPGFFSTSTVTNNPKTSGVVGIVTTLVAGFAIRAVFSGKANLGVPAK